MFGFDMDFAFPTIGDERAAYGCGVVEAGDVCFLGFLCRVSRLKIMTEKHRSGIRIIRLKLIARLHRHW
jgi:hypothetical protein